MFRQRLLVLKFVSVVISLQEYPLPNSTTTLLFKLRVLSPPPAPPVQCLQARVYLPYVLSRYQSVAFCFRPLCAKTQEEKLPL
jgi:hypothetical protein